MVLSKICFISGSAPTTTTTTTTTTNNNTTNSSSRSPVLEIFKNSKKRDFVRQNLPPSNLFVRFFCPSKRKEVRFRPPNFDRGFCFHGAMTKTKSAILRIFIKNINFFTNQDMIKVISQNCAKTKGPLKKIDKINFEVHKLRIILYLLTLI